MVSAEKAFTFVILNSICLLLALWLFSIPPLISSEFMTVIIVLFAAIVFYMNIKIIGD